MIPKIHQRPFIFHQLTGIAKRQIACHGPQAFNRFVQPNPKKFFACHTAVPQLPMNGSFVFLRSRAFKICFNVKR